MSNHTPFRAGRTKGRPVGHADLGSGPATMCVDISEFQPDVNDATYLSWSKAAIIRALYGTSHVDGAWYGGQRRAALHSGGALFLGIYAFLAPGQSGAAQAQAFHHLVGPIQRGEVFIADFETGSQPTLTDWRNEMVSLYGQGIKPYLWTYTGLSFGQENGLLPVQWIADYASAAPGTPHTLWQFTDSYQVPGVGTADCSVFAGPVSELAALAYGGSRPAPQPASSVAEWTCQGQKSLAALAAQLGNQASTILRLTAGHSPSAQYTANMSAYINEVAAADTAKVPAGVVVFHPAGNAVQAFTSHGTQTLQGLADTWKCEPSTLIRLTAEKSPSAQFTAGMAVYLNGVFGRSSAVVPSGIHIYYES